MTRRMVGAIAAGALALALVGGSATVALAVDGDPDAVPPVEEVIADEVVVETEAVEEETSPPELEPVPALAPGDDVDPTPPNVWVWGVDQLLPRAIDSTFTLEFECGDDESGIESCTEESGAQSGDTVRISKAGWNIWWVTAVNGQGSTTRSSIQVWGAPVWESELMVTYSAPERFGNWYNTPVTVILDATTRGDSPIREIVHRTAVPDSGWGSTAGSSVSIPFTDDGQYLLEYYAVDEDVQTSIATQQEIWIDTVAPVVIAGPIADGETFDQGESVGLYVECGDERSGIDTCESESGRYLDTSEPGEHRAVFRAVDNAGNETLRVIVYNVLGAPGAGDDGDDDEPTIPTLPVSAGDPGTLAFTGTDTTGIWALLLGGLVLVGLGVAAAILTRRVWPSS